MKRSTRAVRVAGRTGRPFARNPLLADSLPRWRSRLVQGALLCGFALLAARAVWLQSVSGEFLRRQGAHRYARTLELPGPRGRIVDRDGATLAAAVPAVSAWAIPDDLRDVDPAALDRLARLLGLDAAMLRRRAAAGGAFMPLADGIDPATGRAVAGLGLRGVGLAPSSRRAYPQGAAMSQLVGFVGRDGAGLEGIELAHDAALAGTPGSRRVIRDRLGNIVEDAGTATPPRPGRDVVLSISGKLQYAAFQRVKEAVETFQARAGSAVVVDARTGEVLAMANYPSYDPDDPGTRRGAPLRNRALTDTYEPGSVLKPFTVALAIDRGRVTPDSLVDTGNGRYTIQGAPISDTSAHGTISVSDVLRYSSNIGTAKLALDLPARTMWETFTRLGFGQAPQVGFPGAAAGRLRPHASWRPIEQATMSYGNGISMSLLQLARSYTIFCNDGRVVPLTLEKRTEAPAGTPVVSPATARAMRTMLERVVTEGTARQGRIPGYRVGAKTGTAYKAENGRYVFPRKYVASFVGIVPMSAPRFIVAVSIDEPSGRAHYGGQVAAPAFAAIAAQALQLANVAPDAPLADVIAGADDDAGARAIED